MTSTLARPDTAAPKAPAKPGKRLDIQGLRAIAVAAVVAHHVEVLHLPGGFTGVDIFFVISGFLITGHLVRGVEKTGTVDFRQFYARRIRRLLPAATAVTIFTAIGTYLYIPPSSWRAIATDLIGAATYSQNWILADRSVDYLTQDSLPSPLQHFWSLAVEEQFYILWPLVIFAGAIVLRLASLVTVQRSSASFIARHTMVAMAIALALIAVPSFYFSLTYTQSDPATAYFHTFTRIWELALGGFVAILSPLVARVRPLIGGLTAWAGLAVLIYSMFAIDGTTPYPGSAAVLPTLGTAAVIAGGVTGGRFGPGRLLGIKPAQKIGDWSYSIYLWHWPLVVFVIAQYGEITAPLAVAIVVASLVLGWLSFVLIEQPFLTAKADQGGIPATAILACAVCISLVAAVFLKFEAEKEWATAQAASSRQLDALESGGAEQEQRKFGAEVLPAEARDAKAGRPVDSFESPVFPAPSVALNDRVECPTSPVGDPAVTRCEFDAADDPSVNVALVGDSHAAQWLGALVPIAEDHGWALTAYIHDACPFAQGELLRGGERYADCIEWNDAVLAELTRTSDLDAVFTSNFTNSSAVAGDVEDMAAAHGEAWQKLTDKGVRVIVIRDNPISPTNAAECAEVNGDELTRCAFPRDEATADRGVAQMLAAEQTRGVVAVDLNDAICPTDPCAVAIGEVLVYRDTNHITRTYALSLRPRLERAISRIPDLLTDSPEVEKR